MIAPATLITALLSYFGWVRTRAQSEFLGFDASVLPLSTEDYVLRSIGPMFWPIVALLIAVLLGAWSHALLLTLLARGASRWRIRRISGVLTSLGAVALVLAAAPAVWRRLEVGGVSPRPLAFLFGVAATAYGLSLLRAGADLSLRAAAPWLDAISRVTVVLLLAGGLLWGVGNYAYGWGVRQAERLADRGFAALSSVAVYSEQHLLLDVPGVHTAPVDTPDARYRYRATGLRLLIAFDEGYVLIPDGWSRQDRVVVFLEGSSEIRLEFRGRS